MAEFKEEIADKHAKSVMNKTYVFQRSDNAKIPDILGNDDDSED